MVTSRRPDVGVPGQDVVVVLGLVCGDEVVHRIVVSKGLVHRPGIGPNVGSGEPEPVRHQALYVSYLRRLAKCVKHGKL